MPASRERLLESAHQFIANMNDFSPDAVLSNRTDDCISHVAPRSVGMGPVDNEKYRVLFTGLSKQLKGFKLSFIDGESPIVDEVSRRVVLRMKSHAEPISGSYDNEYVFILTFNEDGTLIQELVEFLDSDYFGKFLKKQEAAGVKSG